MTDHGGSHKSSDAMQEILLKKRYEQKDDHSKHALIALSSILIGLIGLIVYLRVL